MPRLLPTLFLPLLAACSLAACTQEADKFAPSCPRAAIVRDAADLTRYSARGQDLTDLVVDGRITGLTGSCTRDSNRNVVTTVNVGMELSRGPAASGRTVELAYFVAVLEGDRILDKRVFPLRAEFPANADRVRLSGDAIEFPVPTSDKLSGANYRVLVGFQLSPDELALNRRRGAR
jgi:hypothetical protein